MMIYDKVELFSPPGERRKSFKESSQQGMILGWIGKAPEHCLYRKNKLGSI